MLGCLHPTEAQLAMKLAADFIQNLPGRWGLGHGYIKSLDARRLPHLRIRAKPAGRGFGTTLAEFLKSGCAALWSRFVVIPPPDLRDHDWHRS